MALTEPFAGTETVSTTEHSLTTDTAGPDEDTTDGIFQAFIDLNALQSGDEYEIKFYEKAQSTDTQRSFWTTTVNGPVDDPLFVSPSFMGLHGWDITLKKISGTDRTITWSIRQVA